MVVFSVAVLFSLAYLISNGALDWGPAQRLAAAPVSNLRTSSSTIRRVPRPSMVQTEPEAGEPGPGADEPSEPELVPAASAPSPEPVSQAS